MTKILELQFQHQSLHEYSGLIALKIDSKVWAPCCPCFSGVLSSTTVQRHQFFGVLPSLWPSSHNHMWWVMSKSTEVAYHSLLKVLYLHKTFRSSSHQNLNQKTGPYTGAEYMYVIFKSIKLMKNTFTWILTLSVWFNWLCIPPGQHMV